MAGFARTSSLSARTPPNNPVDVAGLPSPFESLALEFSREELKETSYEIFAAACRGSSSAGVSIMKTKPGLNYVPQAAQKTLTKQAASSIKKALGLRSKRSLEHDQSAASPKEKKPQTPVEIVKIQMGISDQTDTRIRRALARAAAGQVGKNVETMLLPLELLQQIRLADFADDRDYQVWQKRQLKVLQLGLLLHPAMKLEQSNKAAQRLRQLVLSVSDKPLETGKNSESMQALRSAATSLASRSEDGKVQDVCHWANGFPFNLHLYQTLLSSCFDLADETNLIDEVDDVVEILKKTWGILGFQQALHNVCFAWVLFRQFVATGQTEWDLLKATETQMAEVAKDAKEIKDANYVMVLSSVLTSIQTWSENRLFAYHDTFPNGAKGFMENLLPVALSAAKILHEDISHEFRRRRKDEVDVITSRIDLYVRSSLKTAFAQVMDQADSRRKSMSKKGSVPGLISLANSTVGLIRFEKEKFSPVLNRWHPLAASIAAATLHTCFSRELKQYLSSVSLFTAELSEVLQSADQLEQQLVQIAVEGAVDSDDGGKGVIREMVPFEAQTIIVSLSRTWMQEKLNQLREWIDRNVNQEDWNPQALREHYGASIVEVFRSIEEILDSFFGLPLAETSSILPDLVRGLDKALHRYVVAAKSGCGSKKDVVPNFPPLTRCKQLKHSSFSGLWKKKEKSPVPNKSKGQENGGHKAGSPSSKICVRINTLYHMQIRIDALEARLADGWQKNSTPGKISKKGSKSQSQNRSVENGTHLRFDQTRTAIQDAIPLLSDVAVYLVVFQDLRSEFWEGLYYGSVAQARISQVIRSLEMHLVFMAETLHEKLRTRLISTLMKVCFEALLMVLLAGGPARAFFVTDAEMLDEDFNALKDLFKADGDGLPRDTVEKAARVVIQILPLFGLSTDDLIQNFRQSMQETVGHNPTKSRMPLPEFTGQWSPTDPNTLLRILCYRCDPAASKFLKKMFGLPKSS